MLDISAYHYVMLSVFLAALIMGAVSAKTNFCTMGAVSDWVNMGDLNRLRAWLLAILVAILGVYVLQISGLISLEDTRMPYRSPIFFWPRYMLGGLLFGIGMTLAGGCAKKSLIRVGGGSLKSLLVLLIAGLMVWVLMKTRLFSILFEPWVSQLSPDLRQWGLADQGLDTLLAAMPLLESGPVSGSIAVALLSLCIGLCLCSKSFWRSYWQWIGGLTVGLVVTAGWYITGGPSGQLWIEDGLFMEQPPYGLGVQSYTFISTLGETAVYLQQAGDQPQLSFGVMALTGVICGSFLYHLIGRHLHLEWFVSWADALRHVAGGLLMGLGGVLALGCTIGHGVTGLSTLALGSLLTLIMIVLGSALSMKVMFYRMVYEQEAGITAALLSSLADLRLIPNRFRRLEKI